MREYIYQLATDQRNRFGDGIFKAFLWLLSCVYSLIVKLRNQLFNGKILPQRNLSQPVIGVGNLTMGGVGKTPIVLALADLLKQMEARPVILTRGYMAGKSSSTGSDEADVLRNRLENVPVVIGPKRYEAAQEFLKQNQADIFIMDDAFQHRQLHRDLNIVAVDALNPWGNGALIPRGILREPLSSLNRADCVILTKCDLVEESIRDQIIKDVKTFNPTCPILLSQHSPSSFVNVRSEDVVELKVLDRSDVMLVSSIGRPESFEKTIQKLGFKSIQHVTFKDHHVYDKVDCVRMLEICRSKNIKVLLTTEKDAVKLKPFFDVIPEAVFCYYLKIDLEIIQGQDFLRERISHLLQR